ncbi:MAG: PqiC family protein [Desulfobacterales bacterium]
MRSLPCYSISAVILPIVGLALIMASFNLSCSGPFQGTAKSTRFYLLQVELPASPGGQAAAEPAPPITLGVGQVGLPEYLKRPQVVTRDGTHRIALSLFDHWGEPLEAGIARVLTTLLARHQALHRLAVQPPAFRGTLNYRLELDISRFDGDPAGELVLAGRWQVRGNVPPSSPVWREFVLRQPVAGDGIGGLVAAHSQALERLATDISEELGRRIPG